MKTAILFFLLISTYIFAQSSIPDNAVGIHYSYDSQGRMITTTNPIIHNSNFKPTPPIVIRDHADSNNSAIRYIFTDPAAVGTFCAEAGNGQNSIVGWYLNYERTSDYSNSNGTPNWEYTFPAPVAYLYNYVAVSASGGAVACGYVNNIYIFNGANGNILFNFDLTTLPDTGTAANVAITSNGSFLVGSTARSDSSTVFGFNSSSNVPVWRFRIATAIYGIKISGNDSLVIINTYSNFWVLRTYTGALVYTGLIGGGTQTSQAISGNGNVIATINYNGFVKVYQWNGSTYNFLWQHQEPPGMYYNWMTAVDVSYDGSLVACGTLNFITNSTYDGKVKLLSVAGGSTPLWTYTGMGDEVNAVSFSKNGRILSAGSWGDYHIPHTAKNLAVFKTSHPNNIPIYSTIDTGSFFWCSTSDDGQTVIASGKRVNARDYGNGGIFYNVFIDTSESVNAVNNNQTSTPSRFQLSQNYPNPFNPTTLVNYAVAKDGIVNITVYDVLGREVATLVNKFERVGNYSISFDASHLNSGVYLYRIRTENYTDTKKMVLIK